MGSGKTTVCLPERPYCRVETLAHREPTTDNRKKKSRKNEPKRSKVHRDWMSYPVPRAKEAKSTRGVGVHTCCSRTFVLSTTRTSTCSSLSNRYLFTPTMVSAAKKPKRFGDGEVWGSGPECAMKHRNRVVSMAVVGMLFVWRWNSYSFPLLTLISMAIPPTRPHQLSVEIPTLSITKYTLLTLFFT